MKIQIFLFLVLNVYYGCVMCRDGMGDYIDMDKLKEYKGNKLTKTDFCDVISKYRQDEDFVHCCVLSGCDYLASIPQIGIKRASNYIEKMDTSFLFYFLNLNKFAKKKKKIYPLGINFLLLFNQIFVPITEIYILYI